MPIYIPVSGEKKKVKSIWGNVNGEMKKITGVFGNVDGAVARMFGETVGNIGRFIAISTNGSCAYYSTDGETWVAMSIPISYPTSVGYGNDRYIMCANNNTCYSLDGETWVKGGDLPDSGSAQLCFFNGRFISFGGNYSGNSFNGGESWVQGNRYGINAAACSDKGIVAINWEDSYYSTDGETWVAMSGLKDVAYYRATYGNDRFVCVGDGYSYYSLDGETWVAMSGLNSSKEYYGVAYGNDRFVCVGESGLSYYSLDGETWVAMSGLPNQYFGAVAYGVL